ncbi:MAG: glycosyltransferase [Spirochaetaceae bacterium]|nr:glycosyltransferase [Spirochaetaceae bacterium]
MKKNIVMAGGLSFEDANSSITTTIELSKYFKILYAEGRVPFCRALKRKRISRWFSLWIKSLKRSKPQQINNNLSIISLFKLPLFPYSFPSTVLKFNNYINLKRIKKWIKKLGMEENLLLYHWNWMFADFMGKIGEKYNIYQCRDAHDKHMHLKNTGYGNYILENEQKMFDNGINKAFVVSDSLKEELIIRYGTDIDIEVLPNAVDYEFFRETIGRCVDKKYPVLDEIENPKIIYCGGINERLDMQLIYDLAENNKDWFFIFYGGASIPVRSDLENVKFMGRADKADVPLIMSKCDVGIMNYVISEFTNIIDPLKMTEYLAAGLPVVSSSINSAKIFNQQNEDILLLADSLQEWKKAIEKAIMLKNNNDFIKKALSIAEKNSIENKCKKIKNYIEAL